MTTQDLIHFGYYAGSMTVCFFVAYRLGWSAHGRRRVRRERELAFRAEAQARRQSGSH